MGFGVNLVTGDYSQGASGIWIENGELAYPVEEITIAGNLKDMYRNIVRHRQRPRLPRRQRRSHHPHRRHDHRRFVALESRASRAAAAYNSPVSTGFQFDHVLDFAPDHADEILLHPRTARSLRAPRPKLRRRSLPHPYRRPPPPHAASARPARVPIQAPQPARDRVARIEYSVTGSEFESHLVLYHATAALFGYAEARRRLKLHTPYFLRITMENAYPRVYSTNRLSSARSRPDLRPLPLAPRRRALLRRRPRSLQTPPLLRRTRSLPRASRLRLRRDEEMHRALQTSLHSRAYAAEAAAVKEFFDTRGESMIIAIGQRTRSASAAMEFERAAALHAAMAESESRRGARRLDRPPSSPNSRHHRPDAAARRVSPRLQRSRRSSCCSAAASSARSGSRPSASAPSRSRPASAARSSRSP